MKTLQTKYYYHTTRIYLMRAAEFIQTLIDVIDYIDNKESDTDKPELTTPMDSGKIMVPPLQQKIEIMKKIADIPSGSNKAAIATIADDDEPFEG